MSSLLHERLLSEATRYGTERILRHMPAVYRREMELVICESVRQVVLHYANGMDSLSNRHAPFYQAPMAGESKEGEA